MVRHSLTFVLLIGVVLVLCGGPALVCGQPSAPLDPVATEEALAELDAAGTPPTEAELQELTETAGGGARGTLVSRVGTGHGLQWDQTTRLVWATERWQVRGRWRRDRVGRREAAGAVSLGAGHWQLAIGPLSLPHGFGLLVGAPGRGAALTADGRLGSKERGLTPWTGPGVPQSVLGAGLGGAWSGWEATLLVGRQQGTTAPGERVAAGLIAKKSDRWGLSVCGTRGESESGVSVAGRWSTGRVNGSGEVAWRLPAGATMPIGAVLVQAGWNPRAELRFGVLSGWSRPGPRALLGTRHPVLGDWAGQGTAVRATWRVTRGLGVKILLQRAEVYEPPASAQRRMRSLSDVQGEGSWPGGWFVGIRRRRSGDDVTAWNERFPWQAPLPRQAEQRTVVSVSGGWRRGGNSVRILWRDLAIHRTDWVTGVSEMQTRRLISWSIVRRLSASWVVRAAWSVAWGGDADLVTAAVPFGGYVLPRHWGHWRQERLSGLEYRLGALRVALAASWREAAWLTDGTEAAGTWAAWGQAGWTW